MHLYNGYISQQLFFGYVKQSSDVDKKKKQKQKTKNKKQKKQDSCTFVRRPFPVCFHFDG